MAYVIGEPCIDSTDRSCIEVCPVDCIYEGDRKLYIHPAECIDCGACEMACPVGAISIDRMADPVFKLDSLRFFDETLPGRPGPLGVPGGAAAVGPLGIDTSMIEAYDVPLSEPRLSSPWMVQSRTHTVTNLWHRTPIFAGNLVRVRCSCALQQAIPNPKRGGHVDATDSGVRQVGAVPLIAVSPDPPARFAVLRRFVTPAPRPALQGLFALAIYLAVFIIRYGLPLISHLGVPNLRQYWTDPNFYTWAMQWWPYAVSHGINPLYSTQIGAPGGYNLAWATTTPSVGLLMWPVTAAVGIVASFNLTLLLIPPVSAWAAFVVARRLTGRFWASLLAGAVYGLTPFELVHDWQGQPNLTVIALFPLMVYLVVRWWDGSLGRTGFVIWMTVAMAVEFYTFNEAFADMTVMWAGGLVIGFVVAGRAAWLKVARLGLLTAIAYVGAIVISAPYLVYALRNYPKELTRQQPAFSLHLIRLVLPVSDKLFGLTPLIAYSNHLGRSDIDDYVGLPLLLIPFALAVFARSNRIARLLAIGFVFVIALAAGPILIIGNRQLVHLPWGKLWSLPIARSAEPSRLIIFAYLVLAIALALWLAAPTGSRLVKAARWGLGLLAVAMVLADLPTSYGAVDPLPLGYQPPATMHAVNPLPAFMTDGLYRKYLRPGEIVVIVTYRGNAGLLFQADADFYFRIAGGFINDSLTTRQDALPAAVGNLSNATRARIREFKGYVHSAGVGAIIVEQAWAQPWMLTVFDRAGLHGTSVGGVTIYPTGYGA